MRRFEFVTLDVFTEVRFGGNPLAVFPKADGLTDGEMQSLAVEFNLSETTFVLPPFDTGNTVRLRIFNRSAEMSFAGHPVVGTAHVLASSGSFEAATLLMELPAGVVPVEVLRDGEDRPRGALIIAPQPLSLGDEMHPLDIAECLGLNERDLVLSTHVPRIASVGNPFVIVEVRLEALSACLPDIAAFRRCVSRHPHLNGDLAIHAYARDGERLRARMFAPLHGTWEDPATGSANAPLGALLLALSDEDRRRDEIVQGMEMGRPSRLTVEAWRTADGIMASVSGCCVIVSTGWVEL